MTCSGLGTSLPGSGSLGRCLCWKAAPPPLSRPRRRPHCLGLGLVGLLIPPIHTPTPTLAHLPALREKALEEGLVAPDGWRQGKATTPTSETPGLRGPRSGLTKETSDTVCVLEFPPDTAPEPLVKVERAPWRLGSPVPSVTGNLETRRVRASFHQERDKHADPGPGDTLESAGAPCSCSVRGRRGRGR